MPIGKKTAYLHGNVSPSFFHYQVLPVQWYVVVYSYWVHSTSPRRAA